MIHGQVMQPPVEAGHVDVKQASSAGKIVNFKGEKPRTLYNRRLNPVPKL